MDLTYTSYLLGGNILIEEITGGTSLSPKIWQLLSKQVWAEHGENGQYRELGHFPSGAPYVEDSDRRISISHTKGMLVVASCPPVAGIDLEHFNESAAIGIDVERVDRQQVIRLRKKFLHDAELEMIDANDVESNVIAWTCKEALYKASLQSGLDWKDNYRILEIPTSTKSGHGEVQLATGSSLSFHLHTYRSEDYIITLAYSPQSIIQLSEQ